MKQILVLIVVVILVSCGSQKQLQKAYLGKSISAITERFGEPKTILQQGMQKTYVFELTKNLESTEVSQGKLSLDPIITPKVKKTERYYFTVENDKVVKTKFEEEYER